MNPEVTIIPNPNGPMTVTVGLKPGRYLNPLTGETFEVGRPVTVRGPEGDHVIWVDEAQTGRPELLSAQENLRTLVQLLEALGNLANEQGDDPRAYAMWKAHAYAMDAYDSITTGLSFVGRQE